MSTGGNQTQSWSCNVCTFLNPPGSEIVRVCEICGSVKDAGASAISPNTNANLGLYNPNRRTTEQKGQHDRLPLAGPEITGDIWSCPLCTLRNPTDLQRCQACNYMNTNDAHRSERPIQLQEASIKQMYRDIVAFCSEDGNPFVDDSFPPAPKSLYYTPSNSKDNKVTQWLRPQDILTDSDSRHLGWEVLRTPEPSDIFQGKLGNCSLLSALAVIAERPQLLHNILVTKEISKAGAYMVRLCKDGWWTTIIIDDVLPCDNHRRLVYSRATRKQLWGPLIEKAVAKIHGCYEALVSRYVFEGLSTLTGYPSETIKLPQHGEGDAGTQRIDPEMVWANLLSFHTAGYLMVAGTGVSDISKEEYKKVGLSSNHAYSVLTLDDTNGSRLLQLRNPWGTGSWKGDWGDRSTKWTAALKAKLMPKGGGNGIFWICFSDFRRYFRTVDVCKLNTSWHEERIEGYFQRCADGRNLSCFLLTVSEATEIDLALHQKWLRPAKVNEAQPAGQLDLCVAVFRVKPGYGSDSKIAVGQLVVRSERWTMSRVSCNKMLRPGTYLVLPMAFNHWNKADLSLDVSTQHRFVTALHSARKVTLERVLQPPVHLIADAIIRISKENGKRRQVDGVMEYCLRDKWRGLAVVVENCSGDKRVQVDCDCEGSVNLLSSRNQMRTTDVIPPLHVQVVNLLSMPSFAEGTSCATYKIVYKPVPMSHAQGENSTNANHWPPIGQELKGLHEPRPLSAHISW